MLDYLRRAWRRNPMLVLLIGGVNAIGGVLVVLLRWARGEVALGFEPRLAGFFCSLVRREAGQRSGITGRRSSRSSTVSKPTCRHSCATGARSTTRLYYTPVGELHAFALRRARLRRRSFFFLHFQRC